MTEVFFSYLPALQAGIPEKKHAQGKSILEKGLQFCSSLWVREAKKKITAVREWQNQVQQVKATSECNKQVQQVAETSAFNWWVYEMGAANACDR